MQPPSNQGALDAEAHMREAVKAEASPFGNRKQRRKAAALARIRARNADRKLRPFEVRK